MPAAGLYVLILCMLGNFTYLLSAAEVFQDYFFLKKSFKNTVKCTFPESNSLDPDHDGQNVHPDLGPAISRQH